MRYIVETSLRDFPAYAQAKKNLERIRKYDEENGTYIFDSLSEFCDDAFNDDKTTITEVNDFLAYDLPDMEDEAWTEVFRD